MPRVSVTMIGNRLAAANLLPIMVTETLGTAYPSNIMAGVIVLWGDGSYPVALVIFIASIMVIWAKKTPSPTGWGPPPHTTTPPAMILEG